MEATMLTETKLFLRKTEELSRLVSAMKTLPSAGVLEGIEKKLTDLSIAVEKDKCLNAGGKFEWVDSVLVKCLQNGTWLLLDQVNLCSPAILDRLNGLLEPNGALTIGEKGVDERGNVFTVRAHKNFRLFLTMNPRHGEISRAMRNRGVEIAILSSQSKLQSNSLDVRSLLNRSGIHRVNQQDLLLKIYDTLYDDQFRVNEVLQVASFTSQQVAKGFAFEESLRNSFYEICGTLDGRSKREALRKIDEILSEDNGNIERRCYDLDAITLSACDLRKNSRLAVVRQEGFLLESAVEMLRNDPERIDFQDLFAQQAPINDTTKFLRLLLLEFYERTSMNDIEIRRVWSSFILSRNRFDDLVKLGEILHNETKNLKFLFVKNSASESPLNFVESSTLVNNLAISLYFQSMIFDCRSKEETPKNDDVMLLREYSAAVSSGKLSNNLKNEPLIVNFAELVDQSEKIIETIFHNENLSLNDVDYIELRDSLKWFKRYNDLGNIELIDRSRGTFFDLPEISSTLKVHYRWLVKLFKKLFTVLDRKSCDTRTQCRLTSFSEKYIKVLIGMDKFRKFRKRVKKLLLTPSPHFTENSISFHEKLRSILRKFEVTDEDLIDVSKTRLKVASMGILENLDIREKLINVCTEHFVDNREVENSVELDDLATKIVIVKEINEKQIRDNEKFSEIEIWPIYEFFFLLFAYRFQRKFCEQFSIRYEKKVCEHSSSDQSSEDLCVIIDGKFEKIYEESVFRKFEEIPTIPTRLIALIRSLNSNEVSDERRVSLFFELLFSTEEFLDRSFAVKNSNCLLHWFDWKDDEMDDGGRNSEMRFISKTVLCRLVHELLLTKSGTQAAINLRNHKNKKKLLKTIQTTLWRNSLILNTNDFSISRNDSMLLQFCANYYVAAITRVINNFAPKLSNKDQTDLENHFFTPMNLLQEIMKKLQTVDNHVTRGKGWLILGYLQIFLFRDLGSIDPARKTALKSKYIRENISELEHLMLIEELQNIILATSLPDDRKRSRIDHLKIASSEVKDIQNVQTVRPSSSFQNLKEEIENFSTNIGSFSSIFRQVNHLGDVIENAPNGELIGNDREKLQEAVIWKKSLQRFSGKLERNFLNGFPDLVAPMISAISNLTHGVSILFQQISSLERQSLNTDISYNLLRFPVTGPCQENYLNLIKLCASEKLIRILPNRSKSIQKDRFAMAKVALRELENFSCFVQKDLRSFWRELNKIFLIVRILWREQEKQREEEMKEKQSLFRTKSEKEEDETDFRKMFPSFQQDFLELAGMFPGLEQEFPELQKLSNDGLDEKGEFHELISLRDAREIQTVHWNILKNSTGRRMNVTENSRSISRRSKNNLKQVETDRESNFIDPLVQRFEMLGCSVETWPEDLSSKLICSLNVLFSRNVNFGASQGDVYDFYRDPNIVEVEECQPLFESLNERIDSFLIEWPENPILISIKLIIDRILGFPINSSLLRFLVGVELLLTKIQEWEANALYDVSLATFIEIFGKKILHWRKLELSNWKHSLEILEEMLKAEASIWWFILFDLVDQYLAKDTINLEENEEVGPTLDDTHRDNDMSKEKVTEILERFLAESSLIQFEPRLQLVYLFYQHIDQFDESEKQRELSAILWNIYHYYSQFVADVDNKIKALKQPIAKKLKDTIKITRWNDISYWSVKNTAEKTRRTLHKFIKEFQKGLRENVAAYLTLKIKPEILEVNNRRDLDPSDFLVRLEAGKLSKVEKMTRKACQFCENIVDKCNYSQMRKDIEVFIEDTLEESKKLKNLDVDKTLTKNKQQSQLKSMLQQKKLALANYFKSLSQLGLSYRIGMLTWKNRKNEIMNYGSTPLDLLELQRFAFTRSLNENVDKGLFEQWSGCDKYYYESLVKLNFLHGILNSGKSDIGMHNAERCRGFSVHLILLAHKQKKSIGNLFKNLLPLRIQLLNFALMVDDSVNAINDSEPSNDTAILDVSRQRDLQRLMENFQELLEVLELSLKQVILFLESCPTDSVEEEKLLDLNETVRPVLKESNVVVDSVISMKDSLKSIKNMTDELNKWISVSKRVEKSGQIFFFHRRHVSFLETSYQKINEVKEKLTSLSSTFTGDHPISENFNFMVEKIDKTTEHFKSTLNTSAVEESEKNKDLEEYQKSLDTLITQVLLVIQKKFQDSQKSSEGSKDPEKESEETFEDNFMTDRLIESVKKAISELRLNTISKKLGELLQIIYQLDAKSANDCIRSLLEHLPLLKQYILFCHYFLHEQVASFRLTCKLLYLQLNVFLELATNGFCQSQDANSPEDNQDGDPSQGGMGLADGEGQKDVSDRIESEDQLEETVGPNEEKQDSEKKDTNEEDKGIEMSENFDSHLQDLERDEEDKDNEEDEDLDKEMGETDETAEKLDEEIWKDDEEDEENEEGQDQENKKEEKGSGQETGEEELSTKDGNENKNEDEDKQTEQDGRRKEEEKKDINELDEPEMNDDQIDPYHGKHQPEVEPEAFDLPEDMNLDDEMKEDKENGGVEENPFDIDQMKESKIPEEVETEESKEEEDKGEGEQEHMNDDDDDTDEDQDPQADKEKKKDGQEANTEEDKQNDSEEQNIEEEKALEEEKAAEEDTVSPSLDASSKEVDAAQEVESRKDGSRDAVESQSNEENSETSPTEMNADDKKDKGTGQSQTEERQGHSGSKKEENAPTSGEEKSSKPIEKRRKPGQSDENRSLLDDEIQPSAKKLKTGLMRQEPDDVEEEENDAENGGASEVYEHIKQSEKFDDVVFDAATQEQLKKQASNLEEEEKMDDKTEDDDIKMHEDPVSEDPEDKVEKEHSSKTSETKKETSTRAKGDRSDDIEEIELGGEVEGDAVETSRVSRGNESTFHTKLSEADLYDAATEDIAKKRSEIENMLGQWSQQSTSVEAANAWSSISALTESAARELSEKLRLVLEPTLTSRLKGDYRTGRRINMRKVIPYIASEFRKDKIWLRRTKPSKRDYQIVLAIDDSSSMADSHSKELAFESLSLIGKAMTYLEVGQLAVINFGEHVNILHPFGENFTEESGARLIQEMKFEQKKTMVGQVLDYTIDMFASQGGSSENAKLVTILSDGRGIFSEGVEKVIAAVRRAKLLNIFMVFIIVDNPLNKDSILDIRMPVFENGKLLDIRPYMDNFPFPFYIILRDLNTLPVVLSDALRQWFEIVGRIDT